METIRRFEQLIAHLSKQGVRKRVAVVWAEDDSTQYAVQKSLEAGFIDAIFVGAKEQVLKNQAFSEDNPHISFVDTEEKDEAAKKAVQLVRDGKADVLMKGLINTDNLLHAVLNKETGILPKGQVLTHVTAAEIPSYDKLLFFTDAAVIPYPNMAQREQQVRYIVELVKRFGIERPKVSLIHCSEKVQEKFFPYTVEYREMVEKANNGEYGTCDLDGPLDVKTSMCKESMLTKGICSPVNGEADALIFPDINAGNVFYKTITFLAGANTAGMLVGTMAPVVLPSRSDSKGSKFYSLAVATTL